MLESPNPPATLKVETDPEDIINSPTKKDFSYKCCTN